jgi:hypothetical protein
MPTNSILIMRTEPWKLIYVGGILSLLSLFIPSHWNGALGGGHIFDTYTWMLGFIVEFKDGSPCAIYWVLNPRLPIFLIWSIGALISAFLVIICSISVIFHTIDIKNERINNKKCSQRFAVLLFLTTLFYVILTSAYWLIPVYGSISLVIGAILVIMGIRKNL